jgi:hypothetical protein
MKYFSEKTILSPTDFDTNALTLTINIPMVQIAKLNSLRERWPEPNAEAARHLGAGSPPERTVRITRKRISSVRTGGHIWRLIFRQESD